MTPRPCLKVEDKERQIRVRRACELAAKSGMEEQTSRTRRREPERADRRGGQGGRLREDSERQSNSAAAAAPPAHWPRPRPWGLAAHFSRQHGRAMGVPTSKSGRGATGGGHPGRRIKARPLRPGNCIMYQEGPACRGGGWHHERRAGNPNDLRGLDQPQPEAAATRPGSCCRRASVAAGPYERARGRRTAALSACDAMPSIQAWQDGRRAASSGSRGLPSERPRNLTVAPCRSP